MVVNDRQEAEVLAASDLAWSGSRRGGPLSSVHRRGIGDRDVTARRGFEYRVPGTEYPEGGRAMVREARFLSDDPWWVDPDRFVGEGDDDADLEPAAPQSRRIRRA